MRRWNYRNARLFPHRSSSGGVSIVTRMTLVGVGLAAGFFFAVEGPSLALAPHPAQPPGAAPFTSPTGEQTQVVTNGPQADPGDLGGWSARHDVAQSQRYDWLLETNLAFRRARERKECGPIGDPQMYQRCIASFGEYEPVEGRALSERWNGNGYAYRVRHAHAYRVAHE
jgi:hypothetical protein